jgi:hypothetical protein
MGLLSVMADVKANKTMITSFFKILKYSIE